MFKSLFILSFFIQISCCFAQSQDLKKSTYTREITHYPYCLEKLTVIGNPRSYVVTEEDTFLDIARNYELGFSEMTTLYPQTDPWMPSPERNLVIPTFWVLPPTKLEEMVINIPEMRLYFFEKRTARVQTYPVGIGSEGWETPEGDFVITEKRSNPKWYVPKSLQKEYGLSIMPPGPDNPLGKYVMRFSDSSYSLHGTHMPWGVGRLISHGCIRCYPEHIRLIYPQTNIGTNVEVIYEPIKFGVKNARIYVEIHPDVYGRIFDFKQYAADKLKNYSLHDHVDPTKYKQAVLFKNGLPIDVTFSSKKPAGYAQKHTIPP